ncbi:MAG: hypothetical protein AB1489_38735 [Acidobacteriota bacterium]
MSNYDTTSPFEGLWDVSNAILPNGAVGYTGHITIKRNVTTFNLDWDISDGRYFGIGILFDDHLFVSCGEQYAGLGVALYTARPDATVAIEWSTPELSGVVGTGRFITSLSSTFEGDHQIVQYLPNGHIYGEWTVSIERVEAIYQLTWRKGDKVHFKGFGLDTSQGLAAGWYPDLAQLAFLDYQIDPHDPQHLQAIWALGGYTTLGRELLTRL